MKYKVIKYFKDAKDNNRAYRPGESYPREGLEVSEERLKELSTTNNRRGVAVIEAEKPKPKKVEPKEEPKAEPEAETQEKPKRRKKKNAD